MTDELKEAIKQEHRRAELQRLEDGWSGCGCELCQQLYREIDLSKYGSRVVETGGIILIKEKSNMDTDRWLLPDSQVFIHYGRKWTTSKTGKRVMLEDATTTPPLPTETIKAAVAPLPDRKVSTLPDVTDKYAIKCIVCGKDFTANRSDAEYCSSSCRVAAHRANKAQGALL